MPHVESSGPAWVSALGVLALKGNKKESKFFVLLDYVHWVCLHLQGEKTNCSYSLIQIRALYTASLSVREVTIKLMVDFVFIAKACPRLCALAPVYTICTPPVTGGPGYLLAC